jgi:hypothetical protein
MTMRSFAAAGAAAAVCACSGSQQKPLQMSDARVNALFNAPNGVSCIELVASAPARTTAKTFDVTAGQSTTSLFMSGIPTGTVMFSGMAFNLSCGFVDATASPSWIADDVTMQVSSGPPVSVQLNFHAKGNANINANFTGDNYTATTIAGVGGSPGTSDNPPRFAGPNDLALSADGNTLYVGDRNFDQSGLTIGMAIRSVDLRTGAVTTLAGSPNAFGTDDGPGASARFVRLFAIALSGSNLIISDRCAVRAMSTLAPYTVTTLIGTRQATNPANWNCSPPTSTLGAQDLDLVVRGSNVYVADSSHFVVWQIQFATSPPTFVRIAGTQDSPGSDDGSVATAHLLGPTGLVFPYVADDPLYLLDVAMLTSNIYGLVRRISPLEDSVTTVAGAPQTGFVSTDGLGTQALFAQPRRAVSDGASIFIGDAFSVRRMDLATNAVVTIAGDMTTAGFADGVGLAARFNAAFGLARDPHTGVLYVADQGNFAIRKLTPP